MSNAIHYYHRDHLGNTCAVWNATADSVVQRTLYYASGMPMAGSTGQPNDTTCVRRPINPIYLR